MAASAFTIFKTAKGYIGDGTIDLDTDAFKLALFKSAATLSAGVTSTYTALAAAITEVSATGGYATGGKSLTSVTWTTGASAGQSRFGAADWIVTGTTATVNNIRNAVIYEVAGGKLVAYAALSTAPFSVGLNNTLTVKFTNGIFNLA